MNNFNIDFKLIWFIFQESSINFLYLVTYLFKCIYVLELNSLIGFPSRNCCRSIPRNLSQQLLEYFRVIDFFLISRNNIRMMKTLKWYVLFILYQFLPSGRSVVSFSKKTVHSLLLLCSASISHKLSTQST